MSQDPERFSKFEDDHACLTPPLRNEERKIKEIVYPEVQHDLRTNADDKKYFLTDSLVGSRDVEVIEKSNCDPMERNKLCPPVIDSSSRSNIFKLFTKRKFSI